MLKNELDVAFAKLARAKKKALIAYLAAGYPKFDEEKRLIKQMVADGVNMIEVGIPFSDPIADGPTIQYASQQALANGASVSKILRWTAALKKEISIPVLFMTYINPILAYGVKRFAKEAAHAGVSGVIVPDVIPEEAAEIRDTFESYGVHMIHLVAPTTPAARQAAIAKKTGGFLYAVSVAGVTGARRSLPKETGAWLQKLRRLSRAPVCVGFGISGPEQIRKLRSSSDGFIVGSALVDIVRKNKRATRLGAMRKFVRALAKECD